MFNVSECTLLYYPFKLNAAFCVMREANCNMMSQWVPVSHSMLRSLPKNVRAQYYAVILSLPPNNFVRPPCCYYKM